MARHAVGKRKRISSRPASKRKRHRSHSRVGGILGKGDLMNALGMIAGGVAAREANNIIQKTFPGTSLNIVAAGQIALGFALPHFSKNPFVKSIGDGMKVIGGTQFAVNLGVISGMDTGKYSYKINGTANLKAINGTSHLSTVNGTANLTAVNGMSMAEKTDKSRRNFDNYAC